MSDITRRTLLQSATALFTGLPQSAAAQSAPAAAQNPVYTGWEHYRGTLGGIWEVWRGKAASDNVTWEKVNLPHCFNARDSVDPDVPYYEGPGWYRTTLHPNNFLPNGRTLLHFEGAGQKSTVYVHLEQEHVGGYDEWTVDTPQVCAGSFASARARTDYGPSREKRAPKSSMRPRFNTKHGNGRTGAVRVARDRTQRRVITVQATLFDANGVPCLDARNFVRFSLAGSGELLDNLGTSTGSRAVEMYNGRAIIRVNRKGGESMIAIDSKDIPNPFLRRA